MQLIRIKVTNLTVNKSAKGKQTNLTPSSQRPECKQFYRKVRCQATILKCPDRLLTSRKQTNKQTNNPHPPSSEVNNLTVQRSVNFQRRCCFWIVL